MVWLIFFLSTTAVFVAGTKLTRYGETIAVSTKLGGLWVGSIVLASATSLPEVITSVSSGFMNLPDIALGNSFGSNIFNVIIITIMDLVNRKGTVLAQCSPGHILAAAFGMVLSAGAAIFILLRLKIAIWGVGIDSLVLAAVYLVGLWMLSRYEGRPVENKLQFLADGVSVQGNRKEEAPMPLTSAIWGLIIAAAVIVVAGYALSYSAGQIAEITGLGATFVGSIMISLVTSLPELVSSITAVRIGAVDMAVGNVLGSNIFNIFTLVLADLAFRSGPIFAGSSSLHALTALLGQVLSGVVILGLIYRSKRQYAGLGIDSIIIVLLYFLGAYALFVGQGM